MGKTFSVSFLDSCELEEIGVRLRAIEWEAVMNFVVACESGHIDFCSKSKTWHKFISIVVKNNVTDFMKSFLILTSFVSCVIVKRCVGSLNSIAGCEIDANDHRHLHSSC